MVQTSLTLVASLLSYTLLLIQHVMILLYMQERTTYPAAFTRATVVIAVKYAIVERPEKIDEILHTEISSFLMLIKDPDRVTF